MVELVVKLNIEFPVIVVTEVPVMFIPFIATEASVPLFNILATVLLVTLVVGATPTGIATTIPLTSPFIFVVILPIVVALPTVLLLKVNKPPFIAKPLNPPVFPGLFIVIP